MEGSGRRGEQEINPAGQTCYQPATPLSSPKAKTFSCYREGTQVKGCRLVGRAAINGKPVFAQNETDTQERAQNAYWARGPWTTTVTPILTLTRKQLYVS